MPEFPAFDIHQHADDVPGKIIVALEKVSEIFRVLLWEQAKQHRLSPLQIQVLIFIHFHQDAQNKVTALAAEFNMTKATISDALRVLVEKDLLCKVQEMEDKRSFYYQLRPAGRHLSTQLAHYAQPLHQIIANWPAAEQQSTFQNLLNLLKQSQQRGLISEQRMCQNCTHYEQRAEGFYCRFLAQALPAQQLRIDCPDFHPQG